MSTPSWDLVDNFYYNLTLPYQCIPAKDNQDFILFLFFLEEYGSQCLFPALRSLYLSKNKISEVRNFLACQSHLCFSLHFNRIAHLFLKEHIVSIDFSIFNFKIQSVNELNHFPSLMELKFKGNPVFQGQIIIKLAHSNSAIIACVMKCNVIQCKLNASVNDQW